MSADDRDVISQGQKLVSDRFEQLPLIAAGEIGATDRAGEQHVTDNRQTLRRTEKDDASRRMPRTMRDLERQLPKLKLLTQIARKYAILLVLPIGNAHEL